MDSQNNVALVLSERLINMPVQIIPPMYRMLLNEIQWAIDAVSCCLYTSYCHDSVLFVIKNEPFQFKHFLFLSRTFRISREEIDSPADGNFMESFHLEDEFIQKVHFSYSFLCLHHSQYLQEAVHSLDYNFTMNFGEENDSVGGRILLVPADGIKAIISNMSEVCSDVIYFDNELLSRLQRIIESYNSISGVSVLSSWTTIVGICAGIGTQASVTRFCRYEVPSYALITVGQSTEEGFQPENEGRRCSECNRGVGLQFGG